MNVSLYHKGAETEWVFRVPYPKDVLTDYTGRWRINVVNDVPTLWIECFQFIPKTRKKYVTKSWLGGLFERTKYVGEVEDGFKTSVYWLPEDKLELVIEEDYPIQQCGGMDE